MNLEGFDLQVLVVVGGHPLPIGLPFLLSAENGVLANCNPRLAKTHVLLWCIASGPL
jgi:hypothetical protein